MGDDGMPVEASQGAFESWFAGGMYAESIRAHQGALANLLHGPLMVALEA